MSKIRHKMHKVHRVRMENWEHHSGGSSIYYYSDIEARWNGEDLEFIAFPVLLIG